MSEQEPNEKNIFLEALEQESAQVESFLQSACRGNTELLVKVRALLDAHQQAGDFLGQPELDDTDSLTDLFPTEVPQANTAPTSKHLDRVGPYKLLEKIGQGGMGSVWAARQSEPIKRKVAIKLIKPGFDTAQVLARFGVERQALAMMDHPNIAKVLDVGVTNQGRPYFAMEFVNGVPLTKYCDNKKLSIQERLELFLPICNAVQHAHQKGIIHRDLKPSNILISLHNDKPVPKVIDFGLAKAMHHPLTEESLYTEHGMTVGTPLYMSPEQAGYNSLDTDTRTDVYALGVILYELLTGTTPLDKELVQQAAYDEKLRLIKEADPTKPSTRLNDNENSAKVASNRKTEPIQLTRKLTGDLDWVVMKALERERDRRYETPERLAEDVQRHLSFLPVYASPPSARYRIKKFIRRNRLGVITASAIGTTLLLGVVGTTLGMLWAQSEKRGAIAAREAQAQISEFLIGVFQSPTPTNDGKEVKVVELLDNAAKKLESTLTDQPGQLATLQFALGRTYHALGLYEKAVSLLEPARDYTSAMHGAEHPDTLATSIALASSYRKTGRLEEAKSLSQKSLNITSVIFGDHHPSTLSAKSVLAACHDDAGETKEALNLRKDTLDICVDRYGKEHVKTLEAMSQLAISLHKSNDTAGAIKLEKRVLELKHQTLGQGHPDSLATMHNLAIYFHHAKRPADALKLREDALNLCRNIYAPEHPFAAAVIGNLASSYRNIGRIDEAIELYNELLRLTRSSRGQEHPKTLTVMNHLASSYEQSGHPEKALQLRTEVVRLRRRVLGAQHSETLSAMSQLAHLKNKLGDAAKSLLPSDEVSTETFELAKDLKQDGKHDEALALMRENVLVNNHAPSAHWILNTYYLGKEWAQLNAKEKMEFGTLLELTHQAQPSNVLVKKLYANYLTASGKERLAIPLLSELIPVHPMYGLQAAMIARRSGDEDTATRLAEEALQTLSRMLEKDSTNSELSLYTARTQVFLKRHEEAVRTLETAIKLAVEKEEMMRLSLTVGETLIAWISHAENSTDAKINDAQTLKLLQKALHYAPHTPQVLSYTADQTLKMLNSDNPEVRSLHEALVSGVSPGISHFIQGTAAILNGNSEKAAVHLKIASDLLPRSTAILNNLAVVIAVRPDGDLEQALKLANSAIEQSPVPSPHFYETRGQILLRLKRHLEAIPDLERALKLPELATKAHKSLAECYDQLGQTELANQHRSMIAKTEVDESQSILKN